MTRVRPIVMLAVLSVSALVSFGAEPVDVGGAGASDSGKEVDRIVHFRHEAGFEASRAFVESTLQDPEYSSARYGVPLSEHEEAEVSRRIEVQQAVDDAFRVATTIADGAGQYMDQQAGGQPVFLTIGDPEALRASIASQIPVGIEFRIESVDFSLQQLEATQAQIDSDFKDLRADGIDARSTALDVRGNRVLVGVIGLDDAATAGLISRYGQVVATREEPSRKLDHATLPHTCVSRIECPPLKGGVKIYRTTDTSAICTAGFIVKLAGTSTLRVLTAGHCIELNGGLGVGWSHHGSQFGTAQTETWGTNSNADAGLISVSVSGDDNLFYASAETDIRNVAGWKANASQDTGDYVCRGGKATGYVCGNIVFENVTRDVDGKPIDHQWEVDFDASPGDSGAPYFIAWDAYGIHSDSTDSGTPRSWYSPMGWVFDKLDSYGVPITLCTSTTC